ncbi:hypothetical protein [Modestobacter italicus]|uniref:hypothetical protein n=1 Tax=Modestobacter italicus (strain DSM 44449 / CECT 9708 / BC 501) TaxID=2732864 RepID=UPI001C951B42|nr:hypothetical protein [Modestobacter italicus]
MGSARRGVAGVVPWAALLLPLIEVALVVAGVLPLAVALVVAVVLEVCFAAVLVAEWVLFRRAHRAAREAGAGRAAAVHAGIEAAAPRPLALLVRAELGMWRSLAWAVHRRRAGEPGETPLAYASRMDVLLWTVIGLTPVEAVVVHLLLPWESVRWVVLALTGYGLVWLIAFALSFRQCPHTLGPELLTLRFGHLRETVVRLDDVVGATAVTTTEHQRNVEHTGGLLTLSVAGEASVRLHLRPGATVRHEGGELPVEQVAFFADDPRAAVRGLRTRTAARSRD